MFLAKYAKRFLTLIRSACVERALEYESHGSIYEDAYLWRDQQGGLDANKSTLLDLHM